MSINPGDAMTQKLNAMAEKLKQQHADLDAIVKLFEEIGRWGQAYIDAIRPAFEALAKVKLTDVIPPGFLVVNPDDDPAERPE